MSNQMSEARFLEEAERIMKEAEQRGIILRLLGSVAVKLHCPRFAHLYESANRALTDIDFMTYSRFNPKMRDLFKDLGYEANESVMRYFGKHRHIYWSEEKRLQVDVFFDLLSFCHDVDFRRRLELDNPTITLTDILLEKMQIVEINEKDLKDTAVLLREHDLGIDQPEEIDGDYIAKILAFDWGFYHTMTTNLNKVRLYLEQMGNFTERDKTVVSGRVHQLLGIIDHEPKSLKWKMRAMVGTKVRWYSEVEEVQR